MKKLLIGFFVLFSLSLTAREITVLNVINNSAGEKYDYRLVLDVNSNNKITKLYVDSYLKGNPKAGLQDRDSRPISNIKTGVVLVKRQGRNVVILRAEDFILDVGGEMELFYLYRGSLNSNGGNYRRKDISLLNLGGSWQVLDNNNKEINQANLVVNKILGIEVGIKEIYFK